MKRGLVLAVLAASLLLTACNSGSEYEGDGGPAVVEGKIIGKRIEDGCNRLTLSRIDRVKNKKTKHYESRMAIGYICIPRNAWDQLAEGDRYEVPKP